MEQSTPTRKSGGRLFHKHHQSLSREKPGSGPLAPAPYQSLRRLVTVYHESKPGSARVGTPDSPPISSLGLTLSPADGPRTADYYPCGPDPKDWGPHSTPRYHRGTLGTAAVWDRPCQQPGASPGPRNLRYSRDPTTLGPRPEESSYPGQDPRRSPTRELSIPRAGTTDRLLSTRGPTDTTNPRVRPTDPEDPPVRASSRDRLSAPKDPPIRQIPVSFSPRLHPPRQGRVVYSLGSTRSPSRHRSR